MSKVHETLVDFASFDQGSTLCLGVSGTLTSSQIDNGKLAATPRTNAGPNRALLDFEAEECVTTAGNAVATRTSNTSLLKTCFQDKIGILHGGADNLAQASNDLSIGRKLSGLEEKRAAAEFLCGSVLGGRGQEIVDAVVVDFVHGYYNDIFGLEIAGNVDVADVGVLSQYGWHGEEIASWGISREAVTEIALEKWFSILLDTRSRSEGHVWTVMCPLGQCCEKS